jgi:hypothetical protein
MGAASSGLARLRRLLGRPAQPAPVPRAKRRRRAPRPRDFQRARVYRWEARHVFPHAGEPLGLDLCRTLVEQAFRWREALDGMAPQAPPAVTDGRGRRHACGSRAVIKLPRWARTAAIVLHECAHGMADDQHGPRFVAAYVALLERFLGLNRAHLLATLAAGRVQVVAELLPTPHPD